MEAGPPAAGETASFRFEYGPATIRYGPDCVAALEEELAALDRERALVVTGRTVGETAAVMDPIRDGLGERLAGVFAGTTPEKRLGTAYDALEQFRAAEADAVVAVGGGSSHDVATILSLLAATDRSPETVGAELVETGTIAVPDTGLPPVVGVPTTLAGAELSTLAGVTADPGTCPVGEPVSGGVGDPALMPATVCYDPRLFATTPERVLAGSAMNGFNKGVETLYARNSTPVTDATAARGLSMLADGLVELGEGRADESTYEILAQGLMLVQYGISRPEGTTLSVIHAFGHGLTRTYAVQQGAAHAVVTPHVLVWLFEEVDGRRRLLARALGVAGNSDPAEAVVKRVSEIVDALGLPTRLCDVDGPSYDALPDVAEAILADSFMENAPRGLDATQEEVERVLKAAW